MERLSLPEPARTMWKRIGCGMSNRPEWLNALFENDADARRSSAAAEHVLWLRRRADADTTPIHVLKIVYVCHGWMLAVHHAPLITEPVEAWTYGPVVPTIYHDYKKYGAQNIPDAGKDHADVFGDRERDLVAVIEEAYRPYTAVQLSALTHKPGTPWYVTRRKSGIGAVIDNELIRRHFQELLDRSRPDGEAQALEPADGVAS